ncbi:MAG: hypothetical protein A3J25_11785, partial [Pseudomonadales bacterium RIFCSPLOWO2_02_FULL_63_210]
TALLWGVLPIKLKEVLQVMDPVTVTWYRLLVSGSILLAYLAASRGLPRFRPLGRKGGWLLALAIAGLSANYVLYLMGLNLLSPGTTQLVIQVAPILLLISSLFVFRERFSFAQGIGLAVLLFGFALFFNQRLGEFLACALLLTPWAQPQQVFELSALQGWLLFACCLNTLVAYGAFAEALAHWEASRVSATLAITPLVTFGSVALAATWWPDHVRPEQINWLAYGGAALVVLGSALTALGPSLMASLRARRVRVAA